MKNTIFRAGRNSPPAVQPASRKARSGVIPEPTVTVWMGEDHRKRRHWCVRFPGRSSCVFLLCIFSEQSIALKRSFSVSGLFCSRPGTGKRRRLACAIVVRPEECSGRFCYAKTIDWMPSPRPCGATGLDAKNFMRLSSCLFSRCEETTHEVLCP